MNNSQKNDPRKRQIWKQSGALSTVMDARIIAISVSDLKEFGCPYCGYRSGYTSISGHGSLAWKCGECGKGTIGLSQGVKKSTFGIGTDKGDFMYPRVRKHPRHGIPSHGKTDVRSLDGTEKFSSRGIGLEQTPGCFVCGGPKTLHNNIAAFVHCKEAGERLVDMFEGKGAYLDYREHEPDRVQVKIGACDQHLSELERLDNITHEAGDKISVQMIQEAYAALKVN